MRLVWCARSSDVDEAEEAQAKYRALQAELAAADSVLLLGAGPVGTELAGEISGPEVASELKGRHLMVEPVAQSLGLEGAPTAR